MDTHACMSNRTAQQNRLRREHAVLRARTQPPSHRRLRRAAAAHVCMVRWTQFSGSPNNVIMSKDLLRMIQVKTLLAAVLVNRTRLWLIATEYVRRMLSCGSNLRNCTAIGPSALWNIIQFNNNAWLVKDKLRDISVSDVRRPFICFQYGPSLHQTFVNHSTYPCKKVRL